MPLFHELYQWVLSWADSPYGIWALFVISFLESSVFPIPPDVLLIALTLGEPQLGMGYATVTTVGSVTGGMLGYLIGYLGGRPLLLRWMGEKVIRIHYLFERYEVWAIAIAGFTPIPYKLFTISAGAFYINFPKFVLVSALSRGARFFLVASILQAFGPAMNQFIEDYFNLLTILFLLLLVGGFYLVKLHTHRQIIKEDPSNGSTKG
jgi:membrane protein YqaA with SNARE-associated domain